MNDLRQQFGERVFPLTVPLNAGPGFNQVLDIPRSEVITFAADKSGKYTEAPASGAIAEASDGGDSALVGNWTVTSALGGKPRFSA